MKLIQEGHLTQDKINAALSGYHAIAWDFDETLNDSPASPLLHQFIFDHPNIRHVIVTFRSHGWETQIWRTLDRNYDGEAPDEAHFDGIINIDNESFANFQSIVQAREDGDYDGPLHDHEITYMEWKGLVCAQNNLPVLIDDNAPHTARGCDMHGVKLFDPLDFL